VKKENFLEKETLSASNSASCGGLIGNNRSSVSPE
jgi:hypothetical protein